MQKPLLVGLTGGIGSGKTAVSDCFADLGAPIIDTDLLARELVEPGTPALKEIRQTFGDQCVRADGTLDRAELRRRIFADPHLRVTLEGILHPRIRQEVRRRVNAITADYCVIVVPLLVESGMNEMMDRVVVVDVPTHVQIERVMQRDGIGDDLARRMVTAQADRDSRLALADHVVDNAGEPGQIAPQVRALDAILRGIRAASLYSV